MNVRIALHHRTRYGYASGVTLGPHLIRLRPVAHARAEIVSYSLRIEPVDHVVHWIQDPHGNHLARATFPDPAERFEVTVDLVAELGPINPFDFIVQPPFDFWPFEADLALRDQMPAYHRTEEAGPRLQAWLDSLDRTPRATVDLLGLLIGRLASEVAYEIRHEPGIQAPEETFERGIGSCRDTAWLLVQILRHLGFAARFVSGYLIQLATDGPGPDGGPPEVEADSADLHAWTDVYLPGVGWVGLDPTSGLFAAEGHIPLACTPEPVAAAPVEGTASEPAVEFGHEMSVSRLRERPRVSRPIDDESWARIDALGERVDRDLDKQDVRLTMGGEPTFVSLDNREGVEWHTAALGPDKRKLAGRLLRRLADRFAPGALLHYGQGKWYPGEPLPRWALSCLWRTDGAPLWNEPALLAADDTAGDADADRARAFVEALCDALGLDRASPIPAHEDAWYHFWLQRRTPSDAKLDPAEPTDDMERDRLARLLEAGLDAPVGYALPLAEAEPKPKSKKAAAWRSSPWRFRTDRLFLMAGDSPMGWRLPLGDLPDDDADLVRTALCVEPREGRLHVFLPPVDSGAGFARLIAALEKVARAQGEPIFFEGYLPAGDSAYRMFNVTPDPGVIEVNIHPSASWRELAERTEVLAEEAAAVRLGTEKFRFDGRPTSTGGGNHVVLGGATIEDSPFLRRPDLLRSMLAYWNNHPSLSYLFSGLFIGPTSQHPRVDEARTDSVYELEIAFQQVGQGDTSAGRHLERVFQNLLVDVTGNTHRAEFCIDKLYPSRQQPERVGLLELRAFEMSPHARMNLVQLLLIRALTAVFWRAPYEAPLARWGTRLHDRFMLPHFVWRDFEAVIRDLNAQGYGFEAAWFATQFEFRFPALGSAVYDDVEIELRQALEPWPVLAEEAVTGGTARTVDASLDRVQVTMRGMEEERHLLVCNGRAVPLTPTEVSGESVAGVRFRTWDNDRGLHPTIPGHAPLVFDLYDRWSGRALGGCTYHVAHPSGTSYESYPVNAQEAAARRRARFQATGHTPGAMDVAPAARSLERPLTLDLRWNPPGGANGGTGAKSR